LADLATAPLGIDVLKDVLLLSPSLQIGQAEVSHRGVNVGPLQCILPASEPDLCICPSQRVALVRQKTCAQERAAGERDQ
jgi:hypothetical protein